ncbi:hypothetical protein BAUCODRAFT_78895 [Baudoinia panamericana UAMH 10762]|uniref:Uncharacterized protein n=1 Tax=Baudoinia panamericana (strain UAMH 10762) TaxID=717646 RepID=M2MYQ4_BAUPA|nr:uncharacterized protein BAUCODRAFT_78895 [Baudoinia panamericana UAMH 10762]EMC91804.1 hypothetical protein BAUCODRAFT_78895 [Baudoinia panamericana UAMH 10762]
MRLLRFRGVGNIAFTKFFLKQDKVPRYAALSHQWSEDPSSEVTFADIRDGTGLGKPGYAKLRSCGEQAAKDGLQYFWLDTCCINKDNPAEVTEAVTRMFQWYRQSSRCYAYLRDVSAEGLGAPGSVLPSQLEAAFRASRWFTRGWTLQELLAPASLEFFSKEWILLGDKVSLQKPIHEVTGIPLEALRGKPVAGFSIADRLSWAQKRQTTRSEDKAYSLLGLLDIAMPLIYGEGHNKATARLRREIENKRQQSAELEKALSILPKSSSAAFDSKENEDGPTCLLNTRVELLRQIKAWANGADDRSIFWLSGMAGTGKSTIARTIARSLHEQGRLGGSFFFSQGSGSDGHAGKLFTTLASELASRIPGAALHIHDAVVEHKNVSQSSMQSQWETLITRPLSLTDSEDLPPTIVFVLDALGVCDKAGDIGKILELLALAKNLHTVRLRFLITSRPDAIIRAGFRSISEADHHNVVLHDVSPTVVDKDLTLFFTESFRAMRTEHALDHTWPDEGTIRRLVYMSRGLFIWASTACRFICKEGQSAKDRAAVIISGHPSIAGYEEQQDQIYSTVLRACVPPDLDDEQKAGLCNNLNNVVGTIVTVLSPLSADSLAGLLDKEPQEIRATLTDLHSILDVPDDSNRAIRLHHTSLREYLLDSTRCVDPTFRVDEASAHKALAERCVRLMSKSLRRNICDLPLPGTPIDKIDRTRVEQCLPPELQYACLHWAEHYRRSGARLQDGDRAHQFLQKHFGHWLEAISLMGKCSEMAAILRIYQSLLMPADNPIQVPFVKIIRQALYKFQATIEQTPLQIYSISPIFTSQSNHLQYPARGQMQSLLPLGNTEYNYVGDLAFTPDGRRLASGSTHEWARVWDIPSRTRICKYVGQTDKISSVAISPDGTLLASGSDDFTVEVWDMESKVTRWKSAAHRRWVNTVCFSPDGKLLASGSSDETIRIYNAADGTLHEKIEPKRSSINTVHFSPDSSLLAYGTADHTILVWNLEKRETCLMLDGHKLPVNAVQFSNDGRRIVSGSDDMTVRVWSSQTGTEVLLMKGHRKGIWAVSFSHNGLTIASGSEDKTIRLWNAETGVLAKTLLGHKSGINSVRYSPNGQVLASGAFNDEVRLWDARTGRAIGELDDFDDENAESGAPSVTLSASDMNLIPFTQSRLHPRSLL